ncbi:MAG: TatD family hydrolase [Alphaproteobacteria bacterium]
MTTILFDSHIHFQEADELKNSGVDYFACCGIDSCDWFRVKKQAEINRKIVPFYGLHPWYVEEERGDWREILEQLVRENKCGIGETGLDTFRDISLSKQVEVFKFHLELCLKYQRPIVIHMVKAFEKTLEFLKEYKPDSGVMIHAYSGSSEMVKEFNKLGVYFSLGGFFIKKSKEKKSNILENIPQNRLLVETDSPTKEGLKLKNVIADIADLKQKSFDEIAEISGQNALTFFKNVMEK